MKLELIQLRNCIENEFRILKFILVEEGVYKD